MTSSPDLFELIKSLTPQEKRSFTLHAGKYKQRGQKAYLKLFRAIDRQDTYNEAALKQSLKGTALLRRFSVAKHHLYHLILRSLREQEQGKSPSHQMRDMLDNVEMLIRKGLVGQAEKLIARAKKIADEHEFFRFHLELLDYEKNIVTGSKASDTEAKLAVVVEEEARVLDQYRNYVHFNNLYDYQLVRLYHLPSGYSEELEQLSEEVGRFAVDEEEALSIRAKLYLNFICWNHYMKLMNYERAHPYITRIEHLCEMLSKRWPPLNIYIPVVINSFMGWFAQRNYEKAGESLRKMESLQEHPGVKRSPKMTMYLFSYRMRCALWFYFRLGEFEQGLALKQEINKGVAVYGKGLDTLNQFLIHQFLAYHHAAVGDYHESLEECRRADQVDVHHIPLFHSGLRIFEVFVHMQLGNIETAGYLRQNIYRRIRRQELLNDFEKIILRFFGKLLNVAPGDEFREVCRAFFEPVADVERRTADRSTFNEFRFGAWIETVLTGCSFAEALRNADRRL